MLWDVMFHKVIWCHIIKGNVMACYQQECVTCYKRRRHVTAQYLRVWGGQRQAGSGRRRWPHWPTVSERPETPGQHTGSEQEGRWPPCSLHGPEAPHSAAVYRCSPLEEEAGGETEPSLLKRMVFTHPCCSAAQAKEFATYGWYAVHVYSMLGDYYSGYWKDPALSFIFLHLMFEQWHINTFHKTVTFCSSLSSWWLSILHTWSSKEGPEKPQQVKTRSLQTTSSISSPHCAVFLWT